MRHISERLVWAAMSDGEISRVRSIPLSYSEYMIGLQSAPWYQHICPDCGGHGLRPKRCCDGKECACMGQPIDFEDCVCGRTPPSPDKIREWVRASVIKSRRRTIYPESILP